MFPIADPRGRVVAFGARALQPDAKPKYLNTGETPLFSKGHMLYNFAAARAAAMKSGTLIVAEGYMDVIALVRAGFEAAVAPLGTALTEHQLALLWRTGARTRSRLRRRRRRAEGRPSRRPSGAAACCSPAIRCASPSCRPARTPTP